jgi:hypothetical protein
MPTYTATFHTDANYAEHDPEADASIADAGSNRQGKSAK